MRAAVMYEAGDVRMEDVPEPAMVEATDAVITVRRAAICGSDLWPYKKMEANGRGRRMGHEAIGVVREIGRDVREVKPGDVVLMPFAYSDGTCAFCREGLHKRRACGEASSGPSTSRGRRPRPREFPRPT